MTYFFVALVVMSLVYFAWQAFVKFRPKREVQQLDVDPADVDRNRMEAHRCYEWLRKYLEFAGETEARQHLNKSAASLYTSEPKSTQS
ncbi:MAG: hypothetical protein CMK32_09980 [Porticoccaceae bacterium]|nr:hypothetical protein [Porticoccaceae bacterium]